MLNLAQQTGREDIRAKLSSTLIAARQDQERRNAAEYRLADRKAVIAMVRRQEIHQDPSPLAHKRP